MIIPEITDDHYVKVQKQTMIDPLSRQEISQGIIS